MTENLKNENAKPYTEEELRAKPKPFLFNQIVAIHEKTMSKILDTMKTNIIKNEHAQALGSLKKGKREKPVSEKKRASCRKNYEKAREALKIKREQDSKPIDPANQ